MSSLFLIYTTVSTSQEAKALVLEVLQLKLAACANLHEISSYFHWEGKLEESSEYAILFKTSEHNLEPLLSWLKANHPYTIPALLHWKASASDSFFSYISEKTK